MRRLIWRSSLVLFIVLLGLAGSRKAVDAHAFGCPVSGCYNGPHECTLEGAQAICSEFGCAGSISACSEEKEECEAPSFWVYCDGGPN